LPNYGISNVKHIIDLEEFKALYNHCKSITEKAWITLLWLTGARPSEILQLTKNDITIEPDKIHFHIKTLKLKKSGDFIVEKRTLSLKLSSDNKFIINISKHLSRLRDESKLFQFDRKTGYNIIQRLGYETIGISLCPYNFRHSRLTLLAEKGASLEELMRFKGSRTVQSVRPYLHARKVEYTIQMDVGDELDD